MDREQIIKLGTYISDSFVAQNIVPAEFFKNISSIVPGDTKQTYKLFLDIWGKRNNSGYLNINQPLLFSRGFSSDSTTEDQLSTYLPEEKILINKDIFRSALESIDLINIDQARQKKLIDKLTKESIGLSNNDILLYYNLIKINQLSHKKESGSPAMNSVVSDRDFPTEIYKLAVSAFNLTPAHMRKVTGGKVFDERVVLDLLHDAVNKKRINPQVLTICLGYKNRKFIDFFNSFMTNFISQRGDDVQDVLTYVGFYILFNGAPSNKMSSLNLSSHVQAFVNDRIGRVKSVYYVAMLFAHTYNVILTAQIYEISVKYLNSPVDQRLKLEKLYSASNRRQLLAKNAESIALRKVSGFKAESLEVLNAFKRFSSSKTDMVSAKDIFENDWRN